MVRSKGCFAGSPPPIIGAFLEGLPCLKKERFTASITPRTITRECENDSNAGE